MIPHHPFRSARARRRVLAGVAGLYLLVGCAAQPPVTAGADTILVVGDSLSAGYGLQPGTGWVPLLERRLAAERPGARVVNASVTGETTVTGRAGIEQLVREHRPTVVVLELGSDDAFAGIPLATTAGNLRYMAETAQRAGARLMVVGVRVPSRYGPDFVQRFAAMYESVAAARQCALVPNLLGGVNDAADPSALFQQDDIHPNERAQATLLDNVWPELRRLLQ